MDKGKARRGNISEERTNKREKEEKKRMQGW